MTRQQDGRDGEPPSTTGRALLSDVQWGLVRTSLSLSRREFEIAECIFEEKTEAQIAAELSISRHTVHTHLERLYRKLGVRSRAGAVVQVLAVLVHHRVTLGNDHPLPRPEGLLPAPPGLLRRERDEERRDREQPPARRA
jgi:DNA-binding CsgD family transcriptional regulator